MLQAHREGDLLVAGAVNERPKRIAAAIGPPLHKVIEDQHREPHGQQQEKRKQSVEQETRGSGLRRQDAVA